MFDYETLKFAWWILVGALLMGFAVTDGMDMGVGSLLPFVARTDTERRIAINTVGPHWDGNQVWFITAGGALFAAWPAVYAAAFSGFYLAMLLVLFALFFRPVGFDYRSKIEDSRWRNTWDWGLFLGGAIPALIFGVAFGNLLQGVPFWLDDLLRSHYQGSLFSALLPLLNPFALLAGVISLTMLTVHGGVWLQLRSDDPVASRSRSAVMALSPVVAVAFALAGIWLWFGIRRLPHRERTAAWRHAQSAGQTSRPRRPCLVRHLSTLARRRDRAGARPSGAAADRPARLGASPRPRLCNQRSGHVGNYRRRRPVDVSLRHAVEPRFSFESDDLGRFVEPSDSERDVLGRRSSAADRAGLHDLVLRPHVGPSHRGRDRSPLPFRVLKRIADMWYFAWILGVSAALAIGVINVMWYEFQDNLDRNGEDSGVH